MSSLLISGLLVFVLSSFNFVLVNAIQCYGCNGEYCNDPLNKDKATIINCSYNSKLNRNAEDISGGNEITSSKFLDLQSLENKLMSLFFNWNTEYVCVKSSYFNSVHQTTMTIRRCMPKNYKNRDACAQLSNTINSGYGTVRNCMSCNTSLCNSASSLTKDCRAQWCTCRKNGIFCTGSCTCLGQKFCHNVKTPVMPSVSTDLIDDDGETESDDE